MHGCLVTINSIALCADYIPATYQKASNSLRNTSLHIQYYFNMSATDSFLPDDHSIDAADKARTQLRGLLLEGSRSPIVGVFDLDYFVDLRHAVSAPVSKFIQQ